MSLQSLIQQGNYQSAQAAYDAITTPSVERRDDQLYTWAGIAEFAEEGTEQLKLAMEANGMSWAVHQFGGSGLSLSHPKIQAALLAFASAGVPGCAALAAQGVSLVAPWQSAGIAEPTLEDVQKAWVIWDCRRDMAAILQPIQAKSTAVNAWLDSLNTSEMTIDQVQAYCDSILASDYGNPQ
jgi:hypothetical protein